MPAEPRPTFLQYRVGGSPLPGSKHAKPFHYTPADDTGTHIECRRCAGKSETTQACGGGAGPILRRRESPPSAIRPIGEKGRSWIRSSAAPFRFSRPARASRERRRGFFRMRDLAPDRFFSSEYVRSYYVRTGQSPTVAYLTNMLRNWPA